MNPSANNKALKTGIAHIGVGNFHRSHQAYYLHQYLHQVPTSEWGICGIALLETDRPLMDALKRQRGRYTLTTFDETGHSECTFVTSIVELLFAPDESEAVIEKLSSPDVKIVTLTITEAGYNIDLATGRFRTDAPAVQYDVQHPHQPRTVFGYLTAALAQRFQNGVAPFTVLSCDNFLHNGDAARTALVSFAAGRSAALAARIMESVRFPNCMVDRITPSVSPAQKKRLNELSGYDDAAPVFAEPFIQWVIADCFGNGRPELERVGVQFTNDVSAYEAVKLRLLNASHSMLAYPAFLAGHVTVDEAIRDPIFARYIQTFMDEDVTPLLKAPAGLDLTAYKHTLLKRLANPSIGDQLARLCFDGASKLPVFLLPTLTERMARQLPYQRIAFLIAAYGHYLSAGQTGDGRPYAIAEPQLDADALRMSKDTDPLRFLNLPLFDTTPVRDSPDFIESYTRFRAGIRHAGIRETLRSLVF